MKVLSGVHPHGTYAGEILFEGKPVEFSDIRQSEAAGIVIIHQGSGYPRAVDRGEHLPGQRDGRRRRDRLGRGQPPGDRAAGPGRTAGEPPDPGQAPRHRQAAAGRDRQGPEQGRQAPDPRRADRRPERRRLPASPRPAQGTSGQGHHVDHDQPQAQRDRAVADEITIIRDGKTIETLDVTRATSTRTASSAGWSAATSSTGSPTTRQTSAR